MRSLPENAFVVRGINTIELLKTGTGVAVDSEGKLHGLSVQSAPGKTTAELAAGFPNRKIGVTTVGAVRAAGGEVIPDPHFTCNLLNPLIPNRTG